MKKIDREYPSLRAHLIGMLGVFAALFLGLALYLYLTSRSLFAEGLQKELSGDLEWMASITEADPRLLRDPARSDSLCKAVSRFKGFRVTIIDNAGNVLADSHIPRKSFGTLENHRSRPEVRMSELKGWGHAWRYSNTLGLGMLYVARKVPEQACYLRMAAGPATLDRFQNATLRIFVLFLALFSAAAGAIVWWISRKISSPLLQLTGEERSGSRDPESPPRWGARFREAEVLNEAIQGYVGQIRSLGREVEKQRDKLVAVLNQLEEGILILSANGDVVAANPSSLKLLGADGGSRGPSAWLGRPLREMLPESPLLAWVDAARSPDRTPIMHVDKGPGAPFDLLCHLAPLDAVAEGVTGGEFLLTLFDVSEFRHLDRVKSEFVANASHELKTPLSSIKGYAEALMEGAM
ncbi:MAG: PAS domain-containing protein, partial [Fibrobacterota bacterium]|nr:PAS domain-containing protein [Fibrobacterota bacterium]